MGYNENSRVKIPALLHFTRLGYNYMSLKEANWDKNSNIFPDLFRTALTKINKNPNPEEIERTLRDISQLLDNEDLGRAFYNRLVQQSRGLRLIDFEHFDCNNFNVVTELTYKIDDEEFRPDITLLINGMPLVFIEVKKPNNREGTIAELNRMRQRFSNPKFKRFFNLTQLMVFSNNMEYDDDSPEPIEGAFYATSAVEEPKLNYFREEHPSELPALAGLDSDVEDFILKDNNLVSIKHTPEYNTNKAPDTPTNRLNHSLFSRKRLAFLLLYGIAYVRQERGYEKHIMRYPQIFATRAIEDHLNAGKRKGIIWHTQGSGKTALAFYNVRYLTDYFQTRGIVPKFYFIVDRLDLLNQAAKEFRNRGLTVYEINSREKFARDIKSSCAVHNDSGEPEITVVNIQKFKDDPDVIRSSDYKVDLQRIFFLDEVHRSYNPKGSFLANLKESDSGAIHIGLTGTPLLGNEYTSRTLFGEYIHKYYYNKSIQDGYTLRLIREEIETQYRLQLKKTLDEIKVLRGKTSRKIIYADERFVEPMLDYIVKDFEEARLLKNDPTIGAMVICDSSKQARMMSEIFEAKYSHKIAPINEPVEFLREPAKMVATSGEKDSYNKQKRRSLEVTSAALILHDAGTKQDRKDWVDDFKEGKIDILFVYNMLLTGFDASRLKKLYLGREIKAHNLLQALTRVNRTYRNFRYGYVVDFADIEAEFEKTNQAYFDELQSELGDELENYSNLFKTEEEILADIDQIKDALWSFNTQNAEIFSQQVTRIQDRTQMLEIIKALSRARELYNIIRMNGRHELLDRLDFAKLNTLAREANNHLALLNQKIALEEGHDTTNILKAALEDVIFTFRKVGESELRIADEFQETLRKTRETLGSNFDPRDPEFIKLREELERLFRKKKLSEMTQEDMQGNITDLEAIRAKARELNRRNELLSAKYSEDKKYARLHKRLMDKYPLSDRERKLFEALSAYKTEADETISRNNQLLENEDFAERELLSLAIRQLNKTHGLDFDTASIKTITRMILKEYLDESEGKIPA